jgi:four helix bundle protein
MQPYERFEAWPRAHELALWVYRATSAWPASERYGLTSQARRAAFSVAANIVEGSAKRGSAEFGRHLAISLGSLAELGYVLRFAHDLNLIPDEDLRSLEEERDRAGKMLWLLYRALRTEVMRRGRKAQ